MTDEYDETHEEETGEETTAGVLPDGVIERLTQYASRTKQELKDVVAQYLKQIEGEHGCTNPAEEDEDLLIDWAEQMFIDTRNAGSGGSVMAGCLCRTFRWSR